MIQSTEIYHPVLDGITLLPNGGTGKFIQVAVAGSKVDVFDPATTIMHHAEVTLLDGTILIAGGEDALGGDPTPTTFTAAWLYTPAP